MCIDLNIETNEVFRIIKRRPRKTVIEEPHLCIANMFDFEEKCTRRCTLERIKDKVTGEHISVFCTKHERMSKCGRLSWGVDDENEYKKHLKDKGMSETEIAGVIKDLHKRNKDPKK
jgi:hypothetical protein